MAKFNETSQEAFLGVPVQKYNKGSWLINNNNNKMADFMFCFKKHLLWNYQSTFNETLQEASLDDLLQKINKGSWLIKTTTATTTATTTKWLTSCFALKKHLWNYRSEFKETLQEASLGDPLQKYNKGSWLINNNNNNEMADFLFCFKKHLLWNYQSKFNETLQEFSLGDLLL